MEWFLCGKINIGSEKLVDPFKLSNFASMIFFLHSI